MRKPVIPVPALAPASALVWWIVGYLAWIIDGLGDGIDGVEIYSIASDAVTVPLLLPDLPHLVLGGAVGGICAGLLTMVADGQRTACLAASFAGVACAVLLTGIQSTTALEKAGVRGYEGGDSFGPALIAMGAAASLVGWLLGAAAAYDRVPLGVGIAALSGAAPTWLTQLVFAIDRDSNSAFLSDVIQYAGAALLTLGLVTIGIGSYKRLLAWPVAIALAWLVYPAYSLISFLGVDARWPGEMPDLIGRGWDIVKVSIPPQNNPIEMWFPFVLAIALALAISVRLDMRRAAELDAHSPVEPSNNSRTTSM